MRKALIGKSRFIATPAVSKHRIFVWMKPEVLCNQGTLVFARDDDYFLGVLQSHIHEVWSLEQGTALEDRPRYTPTTSFETFPLPWPPRRELTDDPRFQAISVAARVLVEKRELWLVGSEPDEKKPRSLTRLYNERPTWLDLAHRALDAAVCAAYGWDSGMSDADILAKLLDLNLATAGRG